MSTETDLPDTADVVVVGCGPAGASAATWLARAGRDVVVLDSATFPRDKTCGDGLTPRAMSELERLGLGAWARDRISINGLELTGFGSSVTVPWPGRALSPVASAIRRLVLDDTLRTTAVAAGARVFDGAAVTGVDRDERGAVTAVYVGQHRLACRTLVVADGVRSPVGRKLGRTWHRDTVYAVAARCYVSSDLHDRQWIGSTLELRDDNGEMQPGYGWAFPLGDGDLNVGAGSLATASKPADVAVKELTRGYAKSITQQWGLTGPIRELSSALLPMGGAVSGIAGPNWVAIGDAAACVNPLNGEGIDSALEGGRLAAEMLEAHPGQDYTHMWPNLLRDHYGGAFSVARNFALLLTLPHFMSWFGPLGMRSQTVMAATVRCMSNAVTDADRDLLARLWRLSGQAGTRLDRRPLFAPAD